MTVHHPAMAGCRSVADPLSYKDRQVTKYDHRLSLALPIAVLLCSCTSLLLFTATWIGSRADGWVVPIYATALCISLVIGRAQPALTIALLIGISLRFTLIGLSGLGLHLPDSGVDVVRFDTWAWQAAQRNDVLQGLPSGANLYAWFVSIIYRTVGHSPLVAQSVNAVLGSMVVVYSYRTAEKLSGARAAACAAGIAALHPTLNLYSVLLLREAIIAFCLSAALWNMLVWWEEGNVWRWVAVTAFSMIAGGLHTGVVPVVVALQTVGLLRSLAGESTGKRKHLRTRRLLTVMVCVLVVAMVLRTGWSLDRLERIGDRTVAEAVSRRDTTARASYLTGLEANSTSELVLQLPIRAVYFLLSPFPWQISAWKDIMALADVAILVGILYLMHRSIPFLKQRRETLAFLVVVVVLVATFAVGTGNYGTAIRHRAKSMACLAGLAGVALDYVSRGDTKRRLPTSRPLALHGVESTRAHGK